MSARRDPRNPWDFPLIEPRAAAKRLLKLALGRLVLAVRPDIARRVEASGKAHTFTERLALAGLIARHRAAGTLDKLAHFHTRFWAGDEAVAVHAAHADRFDEMLRRHRDFIDELVVMVAAGSFHTLCEIGCGTGRLLALLAGRLPPQTRLVGLDLSADQIARNKVEYAGTRIDFVAGDAVGWVAEHAGPGCAFLTFGGVLEYLPQPMLQRLLAGAAAHQPVCFAILEPVAPDLDLETEHRSRVYGEELSFSHNYPRLLSQAGFQINWLRDETPGGRWLKLIAVK